jgi:SAM-dependent methyltransferase
MSVKAAVKNLRTKLFKITHLGKKNYCIICNKTYRRFMHEGVKSIVYKKHQIAGAGYKKNVRCPNCLSADRQRLLFLFFALRVDVSQKKIKLLHIAPNRLVSKMLRDHESIEYICGSLNADDFKDINGIEVDVTKIGFSDNHFDVVICNHVIEHVPNDAIAFKELFRVVKPGGFAILQVPIALDMEKTFEDTSITSCKERKIAYGQSDHLRLYGLDYFDKLKNVGFRVVRDNPFVNHWADDLDKHRLDKIEDVIICYKD